MSKGSVPAAPDYTPFITGASTTAAADLDIAKVEDDFARDKLAKEDYYAGRAADLGDKYATMAEDQAAYGKSNYEKLMPYLTDYLSAESDYTTAGLKQLDVDTKAAEEKAKESKETYDRYMTKYVPLEDKYTDEAWAYASKARQDEAAAAARGDVATSYGATKDTATRLLQSYGVDPSQGAFGRTQAYDISNAAAQAAAGTYARQKQELYGKELEANAVQIGQKLPVLALDQSKLSTDTATAGLSGSKIGGDALSSGSSLLTSGTTAMGSPTSYASYSNPYTSLSGIYGNTGTSLYGSATSALGNAGSAYGYGASALNSSYSNQLENYKATAAKSPWGAVGTIAGAALKAYTASDRRIKKDITPYEHGLDEVLDLNPVTFAYNGTFGFEDDGHTHVGLIAQDVEPVLPEMVASIAGVKHLDMNVILMTLVNAVKELTARIEKLEGGMTHG
jgi:hypothetical protein